MKLEELKCKECGAPITPPKSTDRYCCCGYCGMTYSIDRPSFNPFTMDYEINIVPRYHNIDTLVTQAKIPNEILRYYNSEEIKTKIHYNLAHSLADKLTNYLIINKNLDFDMSTIYRAKLMVVEP